MIILIKATECDLIQPLAKEIENVEIAFALVNSIPSNYLVGSSVDKWGGRKARVSQLLHFVDKWNDNNDVAVLLN